MKYMLLIYGDESCWTTTEREACMVESMQLSESLVAAGKLIMAAPLHSVQAATSLKIRNGQRLLTDGPFAETAEQLGGFYLIDVEHLDEAIEIAGKLPPASKGTVEIRPVFDVAEVQDNQETDIISRRDFPFTPEQIYAAFRDPERLARWYGPEGFTNQFSEFEFESGGTWNFVMVGPDGKEYDNQVEFRIIDEPNRLEFDHVNNPGFRSIWQFIPLTNSTTHIHWRMRFQSVKTRNQLAEICLTCNEQNFDRLLQELQRSV